MINFILSLVKNSTDNLADYIVNFIEERFKYYLKDKYDKKYLDSVINLKQNPDIYSLILKLEIIVEFMNSKKGLIVSQIYNRVVNILNNDILSSQNIDEKLFKQDEEISLHKSIDEIYPQMEKFVFDSEYNEALNMICGLESVTNNFFDNVLINSDDVSITNNRKALLYKLKALFDMIGDFGFIRRT
jgi:glycyl-tRNA synthetase beta chain